ncbi:MAG TPA: DUF4349 domain-containing protein [bacterium]|nr:DUF4349 domain-containing protein [bacterium]
MFRPLIFTALLMLFMAGCASYEQAAPAMGYYDTARTGGGGRQTATTGDRAEKKVIDLETANLEGSLRKPSASVAEPVMRAAAQSESYEYDDEAVESESGSGSYGDASADYDGGRSYGGESYGVGGISVSGQGGANYGAAAKPAEAQDTPTGDGRMVIYRSEIWASVDAVGDAVKNVEKLAADLGGRIDSVSTQNGAASATIVLRVPAAKFDEAIALIEKIGEITGKNLSADDVTEEFRDTALRLNTQKMILARFEELLKKATDPKERVDILREIERISSDIAALEQRLSYLKDQADFSTITLYLSATVRDAVKRYQPSPFRWLRAVGPDSWPVGYHSDDLVYLKGPDGFFAAREDFEEHRDAWLFQSPQGTVRVRLTETENYPKADATFWTEALTIEMGNRLYKQAADEKLGAFATRTYEVPGERRYLVGFAAVEDDLFIVEAVFDAEGDHAAMAEIVKKFIGSVEVRP